GQADRSSPLGGTLPQQPGPQEPQRMEQRATGQRATALTPQWLDNPGGFPPVPPLPEPITLISEPGLRQRASEAWGAAYRLRKIIDVWRDWFGELGQTGDADPGAAFRLSETTTACVQGLLGLRAKVPSFEGQDAATLLGQFPVIWVGPPSGEDRWQADE